MQIASFLRNKTAPFRRGISNKFLYYCCEGQVSIDEFAPRQQHGIRNDKKFNRHEKQC
jgi:hypothetical protein